MITMVMMMNLINDNDTGYITSMAYLEGSKKDLVGMTNMFIRNSLHYSDKGDDVNIKDDESDDGDDDDDDDDNDDNKEK